MYDKEASRTESSRAIDITFPLDVSKSFEDVLIVKNYRKELDMNKIVRSIQNRGLHTHLSNTETQTSLKALGGFMCDMAKLRDTVTRPASGEELHSFVSQVLTAHITGEPIPLYTPFCPDWSRDAAGKYDFKSLGGGISFIARKFYKEVPPLLSIFKKHNIPYEGVLIFADWGLEVEINARDTYGRKLTRDDIDMCFASTLAKTDERLAILQNRPHSLYGPYQVISMTELFHQQGIDPDEVYAQMYSFFETDPKGRKLAHRLHEASFPINRSRLGLAEEDNRKQAIQSLAEYATLGYALGDRGVVIAAESPTATQAYNLPRKNKLPVIYLKGASRMNQGENIL